MKKFLLLPVLLAVGFGILVLLNTESPGDNKEEQADTFPGTAGDFVTTGSGLKYRDEKVGDGKEATPGHTVVVHYTGWLKDGKKFESSRDHKEPYPFPLGAGRVIKGWDEGIAGMKVGGRRVLDIPPDLGYGPAGSGAIPPNAELIFVVELLDVK